jgi:hypothetical protein
MSKKLHVVLSQESIDIEGDMEALCGKVIPKAVLWMGCNSQGGVDYEEFFRPVLIGGCRTCLDKLGGGKKHRVYVYLIHPGEVPQDEEDGG